MNIKKKKGSNSGQANEKTLIGVLASHDSFEQHQSLQNIFKDLANSTGFANSGDCKYHFLITGGTYERLIEGKPIMDSKTNKERTLKNEKLSTWLKSCSTKLPSATEGGVIILSYLITQHRCSIVWPFFSSDSQHWQHVENLAFTRLCDQCHVKRLLNERSVRTWIEYEEDQYDSNLKLKANPKPLYFPHFKRSDCKNILDEKRGLEEYKSIIKEIEELNFPSKENDKFQDSPINLPLKHYVPNDFRNLFQVGSDKEKKFEDMTIALIAHDGMKPRMIDFAVDYEAELKKFKKILATGTTGREVAAATSKELDGKLFRYHSGPKGGDIEIAASILYGLCDLVIFFIDPLNAHPHIEDIRVVFQACMMNQNVIIITNEMHAREFMARVVRNRDKIIVK